MQLELSVHDYVDMEINCLGKAKKQNHWREVEHTIRMSDLTYKCDELPFFFLSLFPSAGCFCPSAQVLIFIHSFMAVGSARCGAEIIIVVAATAAATAAKTVANERSTDAQR